MRNAGNTYHRHDAVVNPKENGIGQHGRGNPQPSRVVLGRPLFVDHLRQRRQQNAPRD